MSDRAKLGILWAITIVVVISLSMAYGLRGDTVERILTGIGEDTKNAVNGEYRNYEFRYNHIGNLFLNSDDKRTIVEVVKSSADNIIYEIADTVYNTRIEFRGVTVTVFLEAKYKDIGVSEYLGIEEVEELSDSEFWELVEKSIKGQFKYGGVGKVDLPHVLDTGLGQCYSFSEMVYMLGKENNRDVRMEVNSTHAWNKVKIDGKEVELDVTTGMERED